MAGTLTFLCPPGSPGGAVSCRSGNAYTANSQGVIVNVQPQDVLDMFQAGCIPFTGINTQACWVAGRFYGMPIGSPIVSAVNQLTVTGTLYAYPIFIPNQIELQNIYLGCATGQTGGAGHAGIYSDNDSGYPSSLVFDSGALACTATANPGKSAGGLQIAPGLYWLASIFTATTTFPTMIGISTPNLAGFDTLAHLYGKTAATNCNGISVTGQNYGALPASFPAGAAPVVNVYTPMVGLGL